MNKYKNILIFPMFWICLVVATYSGLGESFLIGTTAISCLVAIKRAKGILFVHRNGETSFSFFIIYYIFTSAFGILMGYVGFKNYAELLLKYVCLPMIVYILTPKDYIKRLEMLKVLKTIIFISIIYGLIESVIKYNYMVDFVQLNTNVWMQTMNKASNYQPCSWFLHYNYYGCVLILGFVFALYIPYKKKLLNIIYWVMLLEQILVCQSRICWIAVVILIMIQIVISGKITNKKIRNLILVLMGCLCIVFFVPNIFSTLGNFIGERFSRLWIYGFEDGSLGQRLGTLMNWPIYFQRHVIKGLFGTGYQSIQVEFMKEYSFFKGYSTVDSQITVYLVETGIVGVLLLIIALIDFFKKKRSTDCYKQIISYIGKLSLCAFCIECVTLDIVSNNIILSLVFLVIIITNKSKRNYE